MTETGTQKAYKAETLEQKNAIDPMRETVTMFLDKIHEAKMTGQEWVETTPEIIKHYNRAGLNGSKFFIYNGIKVCEHGQSESIEEEMNTPMSERIHGKGEGVVVSGG